jgi:predicted AAA+ superfamily ATPase
MGLADVYERIFKGSMPMTYATNVNRELFYGSYVDSYLQRDIRDLRQVADESAFLRFVTACAARTAGQVTYAELARDADISAPTAKQWLSLLTTSGIVVLVEPYFNNSLKRMVKSPKLYFTDTGLCAYLTRWDSYQTLEASMMAGAFFETFVVSEIIKGFYNIGRRPPIYYYRDTDRQEIDLIVEVNDTLHPFEIKKSATPRKDVIRHFKILKKTKKKIGSGGVICMADSVYPLDAMHNTIPVWLI